MIFLVKEGKLFEEEEDLIDNHCRYFTVLIMTLHFNFLFRIEVAEFSIHAVQLKIFDDFGDIEFFQGQFQEEIDVFQWYILMLSFCFVLVDEVGACGRKRSKDVQKMKQQFLVFHLQPLLVLFEVLIDLAG